MKRKALFKFYFAADKLNGALDRIIAAAALHCGDTTAESAAQRIGEIIQVKICLGGLWDYLDRIGSKLAVAAAPSRTHGGVLRQMQYSQHRPVLRILRRKIRLHIPNR